MPYRTTLAAGSTGGWARLSAADAGTERAAEQLRLLADATTDYAIFLMAPDGTILTWNAGAERMKGYPADEVLGRSFSLLYPAEAVAAGHPDRELRIAARTGRYSEEGWRRRRDGSLFWARVTITALRDGAGGITAFGKVTRDLTQQRRTVERLAQADAAHVRMLDGLAEGVLLFSLDRRGRPVLTAANRAAREALRLTGRNGSAPAGLRAELMCDEGGRPLASSGLPWEEVAAGGKEQEVHWGWSGGSRPLTWFSSTSRPVTDPDGAVSGVVTSLLDVTDRLEARAALAAAHARFAALVAHSSDAICVLDPAFTVSYASPAYATVFGEEPARRIGAPFAERVHPADRSRFGTALANLVADPDYTRTIECRIVRPDRRVVHVEMTLADQSREPAVAGIVVTSRDVTERARVAERLAHEAMHDGLTGLANRALLVDRVTHALSRGGATGERSALIYVDLDHFKRINDSLGYAAGDETLVEVATRLCRAVRPGDTVARLGGDEFVVLAESVGGADEAQALAEELRRAVSQPFGLAAGTISVDCSLGITLAAGGRAEALLQEADTAMHRAKMRGRSRWELYDQALRTGAQERIDTEVWLRRAIDGGGVRVHYQPVVELPSRRPIANEALVRLDDGHGKFAQPDQFIPVAEHTGLIVPLGLEVLGQACRQHAAWLAAGDGVRTIAVNLSARQLRSASLLDDLTVLLASTGLPASALCLEITESSLFEADRSTRTIVERMHELGITLALDDFGTGMSSLAHLRHFPISTVKIDRSFVAGLGRRNDDTALVRSVVGLGQSLGIDVIAEGVETEEQAAALVDLGCVAAQGYLFGRPLPAVG